MYTQALWTVKETISYCTAGMNCASWMQYFQFHCYHQVRNEDILVLLYLHPMRFLEERSGQVYHLFPASEGKSVQDTFQVSSWILLCWTDSVLQCVPLMCQVLQLGEDRISVCCRTRFNHNCMLVKEVCPLLALFSNTLNCFGSCFTCWEIVVPRKLRGSTANSVSLNTTSRCSDQGFLL